MVETPRRSMIRNREGAGVHASEQRVTLLVSCWYRTLVFKFHWRGPSCSAIVALISKMS